MSAVAPRVPNTGPARRDLRDWLVDTGAFLLAAAWVVLVAALWWTYHRLDAVTAPPALLVADVAAGAVAAGAVWLRRRWPVGLAVAVLPTGLFSTASAMAALIALFSVAVRRRPAVTLLLGGLYAATTPPYFAYQINPLQPQAPYWWNIVWGIVFTALVVGSRGPGCS
ncbi:MAG TPA: hypothetical protein VIL54_03170 [Natronosporangium sp.]